MWWLETESHARLDTEASQAFDHSTAGAYVAAWPYCIPVERWNQAAAHETWLPAAPIPSADNRCLNIFEPRASTQASARSLREGLCDGAGAVGHVFGHVTRAARMSLTTCALAACAYYLVAVAVWLWALRDGLTAEDTQASIALVATALIAAWIVGRFEERFPSDGGVLVRLARPAARQRQPVLHLVLDVYRTGVALQLLAFAGFVLT